MKEKWNIVAFPLGVFVGVSAWVICACNFSWWKDYPEDNIVEEVVEDIIEHETGVDIDLSPNTPEKKR